MLAALGLDEPPPSEPPRSGVRGVDPTASEPPPSGRPSWFGRQAERVGCGVVGAVVALALVGAPRADKHGGGRAEPAALVAVPPSQPAVPASAPASVAGAVPAPPLAGKAPREAPHRSAGRAEGESEVVLMKRAGNAESSEKFAWALTWLLRHREQFPAGQLSAEREAAIGRVCAVLGKSDRRCP
jgi:hypothetical protein